MPGSLTTPDRPGARNGASGRVAFRKMHCVGIQNRKLRGSMAGLCVPLSTLRRGPRGHLRMTQGRCGSLLLHRKGLAPSTPCRSPGARIFCPLYPRMCCKTIFTTRMSNIDSRTSTSAQRRFKNTVQLDSIIARSQHRKEFCNTFPLIADMRRTDLDVRLVP